MLVSDIILVQSYSINASSSITSLGCVRMSHIKPEQNWTRYYENIVHEAGHQFLNFLWMSENLIINEGEDYFSSPLRKEPRPLSGIFHGAFVLARTIRGIAALKRKQ